MDIRIHQTLGPVQKASIKHVDKKNKDTFSIGDPSSLTKTEAPAHIQSIHPILFEQDAPHKKKRAIARGKILLEELKKLHASLLTDNISPLVLKNLELLLAKKEDANLSPELQFLLDEIETRAAVEMEKIKIKGDIPFIEIQDI